MLRDSVSKVMLPPEYRMNDNKTGIASKDREQAAVLARSGKFIETSLKLIGEIQKAWQGDLADVASRLDDLTLCQTAHLRFVQEEFAGLQVAGQYGNQVKNVFKSLQRNTSNLNAEGIENLKTAVSIAQPQQTTTQGFQQRGSFQPRCSFGRGYQGGFRPR